MDRLGSWNRSSSCQLSWQSPWDTRRSPHVGSISLWSMPKRSSLFANSERSEKELSPVGRFASQRPVVGPPGDNCPRRRGGFSSSPRRSTTPFAPPAAREGPTGASPSRRRRRRCRKRSTKSAPSVLGEQPALFPPGHSKSVPHPSGEDWWKDPWTRVQEAWKYSKKFLDHKVTIPAWYCAYTGVPQFYVRQKIPSKRMQDRRRCQLAMLARINSVLDLGLGLRGVFKYEYLASAQRLLPKWRREHPTLPVYSGGRFPILGNAMANFTWAMAPDLDLVGTLVRAARNLVHLCHLYEDRHSSLRDV